MKGVTCLIGVVILSVVVHYGDAAPSRSSDITDRIVNRGRRRIKPQEKAISPIFVRVLRRRPVGPSAMNYTKDGGSQFETQGEVFDVTRDAGNGYDTTAPVTSVPEYPPTPDENPATVYVPPPQQQQRSRGSVRFADRPAAGAYGRVPVVKFTRVDEVTSAIPDYSVQYQDNQNSSSSNDYLPVEYEYESDRGSLKSEPQPLVAKQDDEQVAEASRKRVLTQFSPSLDEAGSGSIFGSGDFGYGGVVIRGAEAVVSTPEPTTTTSTTTSTTASPTTTSTSTTTTPPPTTTTTTTTPPPTTTSTTTTSTTTRPPTTTTTTTTTPPPTTTSTTTTTTPPPTTTTSTTTTTPPPPTTTTTTTTTQPPPRTRRTTTTTTTTLRPVITTPSNEELLTILSSISDDDSPLTTVQANTIQQLLLSSLLTSPQPDSSYSTNSFRYTPPPSDLQTSASTLFSTRSDDSIRSTTTKNPLLMLFDNLTGNSNQQRSTVTSPQNSAVSIVRPITESDSGERSNTGGGLNTGDFMRMLIQLPGQMLSGLVRVMTSLGSIGMNMLTGVVKFMSSLSSNGGGGAALFG